MAESTSFRLPIFTFIAQTEVLLVWLLYAPLFGVLTLIPYENYFAYLSGVWWIILVVTFSNYGFSIVEYTARGHKKVPRMGAQIFSRDVRVFYAALVVSVMASAVYATPDSWRALTFGFCFLIMPAITAFVTFHRPLSNALNPVNIVRFIYNMGLTYTALRLVIAMTLGFVLIIISAETALFEGPAMHFVLAGIATYLLLTMFRAIGALLHLRRRELGILTDFSEEQEIAAEYAEAQAARNDFLVELHKLSSADKLDEAWSALQARMKRSGYSEDEQYLHELGELQDRRLHRKMAQGYIRRRLEDKPAAALNLLRDIWTETGGRYRLDGGDTVIQIAELAETTEDRTMMLALLAQFDDHFPDHPRGREAYLLAARLALEAKDVESAEAHFARVTSRRGRISPSRYKAVAAALQTGPA